MKIQEVQEGEEVADSVDIKPVQDMTVHAQKPWTSKWLIN